MTVKIGDPIHLDLGENPSAKKINDATEMVMQKMAQLVGEMRGETPPKKLWDPTQHSQSEIGNYKKS